MANRRYYFTDDDTAEQIGVDYVGTIGEAAAKAQELANETGKTVVVNDCYTDEIEDVIYPDWK